MERADSDCRAARLAERTRNPAFTSYSVHSPYGKGCNSVTCGDPMIRPLVLALAAAALLTPPASAQRRDQDEAYEAARSGAIRPLGEIISRVTPRVGGTFLGSDFNSGTRTYRLKYMREGSVVVVDVDARNGTVLRTTGN